MIRIINPTIFAAASGSGVDFSDAVHRWCPSLTDDETDYIGSKDGTLTNGASVVSNSGAGGSKAFSLDGSNDYVSVASVASFTGFSLWFNCDASTGTFQRPFSWGINQACWRGVDSVGSFQHNGTFWANVNEGDNNTNYTYGTWYFLFVQRESSGDVVVYSDGSSVHNSAASALSGTQNLAIGATTGGLSHWFDGLIDDVVIWNAEQDADNITALYNSGSGRGIT